MIDAYSEEEFAKMVEKGTKAWEGVPDDWVDNLRGDDMETQLVLVESIQQYRMRYVVEVPFGKLAWADDTVVMDEAKEFSQLSLGETIISSRVVSKEEVLKLCDEDNDYCASWTDEQKFDVFVSTDNEDLMEY
jgi:hypothetical protein